MQYSHFQLQGRPSVNRDRRERSNRNFTGVGRGGSVRSNSSGADAVVKTSRGGDFGLGSDEHRLVLADKLGKALQTQICPSEFEVFSMGPRLSGLEVPRIDMAVGDAIRLADSIKIFEQYCKVLSRSCKEPGIFLSGSAESCIGNLSWMKALVTPMHVGADDGSVVFSCKSDCKQDITRADFAAKYPTSQEYEVLVAQGISRMYPGVNADEFHGLFEGWRGCGMLHTVLLCARMMPKLKDWLPEEHHASASGWGKLLKALNSKRDVDSLDHSLRFIDQAVKWDSPVGLFISSTLDRACVLMRIKSNEAVGLDEALGRFPDLEGLPAHESWVKIRNGLERCLPPSLFIQPKRVSWGLSQLTPVWGDGKLFFKEASLEWQTSKAASIETDMLKVDSNTSGSRLQDVISRMGEIAMSPEMGQMMIFALDARVSMENGKNTLSTHEYETCHTPTLLLEFMNEPKNTSEPKDINDFVQSLWTRLPLVKTRHFVAVKNLVAWRVDTPSRIVLYTGRVKEEIDPAYFKPGDLEKVLIDERSSLKPVGLIRLTPDGSQDVTSVVKESLVYYSNNHLDAPPKETVRRDGDSLHTNTCLHEALTCFTFREADLHTKVEVHSSLKWDNEYEDGRYAETQTASNGTRYRDWVSMLANERGNQKSRLDSHVVKYDMLYETMFPWQRSDSKLEWVSVSSTLNPDLRVLHDRTALEAGGDDKSRFKAFVSSVKARFLQDLKLLPVRHESHRVERSNTSVYTDEQLGQVLICYAPTGDDEKRIEFLALGLGVADI